jgi:hypothetical protein
MEVSIFGPGFGECIVLHFGNGDWGIVDSCLEPASKRPAALDYLELLHVDISKSVQFVVATHWHDDHMQGINSVFQAATSAKFVCSEAVRNPDFFEILSSWTGTQSMPGGSGIDELRAVMSEIKKRQANTGFPSPVLASVNKTLWERTIQPLAFIKALSPSDSSVLAAIAKLNDSTSNNSKMWRRIPNIKQNDASVVLTVQVGEHRVLLGADLEVRDDEALGWSAIVNGFTSKDHQGFKVSHHGSPTAHHDDVWEKMLSADSWAATTPFVNGKVRLPSVQDCKRILGRTKNAYLTAPPQPGKFRDPNRTVEKTVNETALSVHTIPGKYGHVRIRKKINATIDSPWDVELFGNATTMGNYLQTLA